ncbi:MAG: energy transducer TonB [Candidatus Aminicenantes bacterium]|nr:energy transducer TonB [Candidatus Aminicenantes bacterium]
MKKTKFKPITFFVLLAILFMFSRGIFAGPDVLVDLRFYKGAREQEKIQPSVVAAYYLKPISTAGKLLDVDLPDEKAELQKIFNLEGIELMTQAKWAWEKGLAGKQFELVVLNGRKFIIQLTLLKEQDHFKLEVLEEGKKTDQEDLASELIIPQGKTMVFGFEDSFGNPYFLSCQRRPDKAGNAEEPQRIATLIKPKLINMVKPVYPEKALKGQLEGKVLLEVATDSAGNVADLTIAKGHHPLLNDAAVAAVKQWKYEPWLVNGKPMPVKFTVVINFSLNDEKKKEQVKIEAPLDAASLKDKPKLMKKVDPVYPAEAKKKNLSGKVVLEGVIDKQGDVADITQATGHPILIQAAMEALKQWKYEPFFKDGKPKEVKFTVELNFKLDKEKESAKKE